ncbi:MAG: carbohydrate porin [Chitinophagaceae bacterium]
MMAVFLSSQGQSSQNNFFQNLKQSGFSFGISETMEGYHNFTGGIRTGSDWASTLDGNSTMDLQKLLGLKNALFYADLEYHAGGNPTQKLTGDLQVFDKHNGAPFLQMLELWYQQKFFKNRLRIKIGKIDANAEFSVIDNGVEFINSSTQVTPTLFVFPTFPDPMPAVAIFFSPNKLVYTNFAVFNANRSDRFLDFYGDPASVQPTLNGNLFISESGLTWDHLPVSAYDGNLKVGFWGHNGTFTKFNGSPLHGAGGIYLIFNQTVWEPPHNENNNRGIRIFLEYARTDARISPVYQHYGGGIAWTGPIGNHPDDEYGLSIQNANISPEALLPEKYELNIETFYKFNISSRLSIKPDIQYIIHPGGKYRNALMGILIFTFALNS